jgi:hypothetical protein
MNVYQTDVDGVFVGITTADQDPMDASNTLTPAGCVETAPPSTTDEQLARWDGSAWAVEDIPAPEANPDDGPVDLAVLTRAERNSLLTASDWTQVEDSPVSKTAWASYRQSLRDITSQAGFPHTVVWPTKPV